MSRKTKYRAWIESEKRMIYSDNTPYGYNFVAGNEGHLQVIKEKWDDVECCYTGIEVSDIVMQDIGQADDQNKEIWDEDILLNSIMGDLWVVSYIDGCYMLSLIGADLTEYICSVEGFRVVGNVYENPEMLVIK